MLHRHTHTHTILFLVFILKQHKKAILCFWAAAHVNVSNNHCHPMPYISVKGHMDLNDSTSDTFFFFFKKADDISRNQNGCRVYIQDKAHIHTKVIIKHKEKKIEIKRKK